MNRNTQKAKRLALLQKIQSKIRSLELEVDSEKRPELFEENKKRVARLKAKVRSLLLENDMLEGDKKREPLNFQEQQRVRWFEQLERGLVNTREQQPEGAKLLHEISIRNASVQDAHLSQKHNLLKQNHKKLQMQYAKLVNSHKRNRMTNNNISKEGAGSQQIEGHVQEDPSVLRRKMQSIIEENHNLKAQLLKLSTDHAHVHSSLVESEDRNSLLIERNNFLKEKLLSMMKTLRSNEKLRKQLSNMKLETKWEKDLSSFICKGPHRRVTLSLSRSLSDHGSECGSSGLHSRNSSISSSISEQSSDSSEQMEQYYYSESGDAKRLPIPESPVGSVRPHNDVLL